MSFTTSDFQFLIAIIFVFSFLSLSPCHNMEVGLFQDFVFTVSLTVIVYVILSKLLSYFAEDVSSATCNSSGDCFVDKAGLLEQVGEKCLGILDLGKERVLGVSGLQFVVSKVDDDHEGKELKEEKVGKDYSKNEVLGGVFGEVLLEEELEGEKECVGGGGSEDIKQKIVEECSEFRPIFREIKEEQESPVAETCVKFDLGEELEVREAVNKGFRGISQSEDSKETERDDASENREGNDDEGKEEEGLFDDWEGIERTELEKRFDAAVVFVASKSNADRIDSNLRMQFYGLHRVAMEGPCHGPQPMALKLSARAKWNAWQKLGNISRDMAMEQYMALLSKSIPGWEDEQ